MTSLEHDGAASLKVGYYVKSGGWRVARTCPCHRGEVITFPFESRELAENALRALDEDARKYHRA